MLTLYDYLPSQNAYKIRLLLSQMGLAFQTEIVGIFAGEGQKPEYLEINPTGAVPAIRLDDGRVLTESNAILAFLADGSIYLPQDRYLRAKVAQWMSFEADYVQNSIGSLRYWTMTGKLASRPPALVEIKQEGSLRALSVLERHLTANNFMIGSQYTIADMSIFAYAHRADEAGIELSPFPHFNRWVERVKTQPNFLDVVHPYSIDPLSMQELP